MLFVIHARDKAGGLPTRLANYDAHKAFLSDTSPHGVRIVMSGPLVADDGTSMIGSLFLVEAADRATVEKIQSGRSVSFGRNLGECPDNRIPTSARLDPTVALQHGSCCRAWFAPLRNNSRPGRRADGG